MSFFHVDVHSEFFTPPEFPVEILNTAKKHDVVTCCLPPPAKQFLAFMLFKEFYYNSDGISVFIQDDEEPAKFEEGVLPNSAKTTENQHIRRVSSSESDSDDDDISEKPKPKLSSTAVPTIPPPCQIPLEALSCVPTLNLHINTPESTSVRRGKAASSAVILCSCPKFLKLTKPESTEYDADFLQSLTLIVIDDVHKALKSTKERNDLKELLHLVRCCNHKRSLQGSQPPVRLVFLSVSLLHYYGHESNGFWRMKETFKQLELLCGARVDTSSDIVALLRYAAPLTERLVPVASLLKNQLPVKMTEEVNAILADVRTYLIKHSFTPLRALGYEQQDMEELEKRMIKRQEEQQNEEDKDSLFEELSRIPHPKNEPLNILTHFELILNLFGPWCADRALYLFINQLNQLKIRVPYVRHYLLLGVLHTRFAMIQTIFHESFSNFEPIEVLENFSTPKLLAVLTILRRFDLTTPHEYKAQREDPDKDEDSEITVADYLNQQKQEQAAAGSRGRFSGRRRHNRNRMDERQRRKLQYTSGVKEEKENEVKVEGEVQELPSQENITTSEEVKEATSEVLPAVEAPASTSTQIEISDVITTPTPETNENLKGEKETLGLEQTPSSSTSSNSNGHSRGSGRKWYRQNRKSAAAASTSNQPDDKEDPSPTSESKPDGPPPRFLRRARFANKLNEDSLCGIILLEDRFNARLVYHFLKEAAEADKKLVGLNPTIALCSNPDYAKDSREAEMEYKKREEALRKFRYREANFLVGTSLLEDGLELPKANLVIRFDESKSFRSYLLSKGRAQGIGAEFYVFTPEQNLAHCLRQLATYKIVEETLLSHTIIERPGTLRWSPGKEQEWNALFPKFKSANLSNAISIINRYCARLPSDTFTRLTPCWWIDIADAADDQDDEKADSETEKRFSCSLRLPINSPVKWTITGVPMPSEVLSKRAVALQTVVVLHSNGELDDLLMPVGKEGVSQEPDLCTGEDISEEAIGEFRPGSTRRRQYYDKQLAPQLIECLPKSNKSFYLYWLKMELTCPLPDEQNTRGRRLHPPEMAEQAFGIVLSKQIASVPPFPIYTRCGEVQVQLVRVATGTDDNLEHMTDDKLLKISSFHHYTFTSVLRLDKYLTLFDPDSSENSYYVVPLEVKDDECGVLGELEGLPNKIVNVDWNFLDRIYKNKSMLRPSPQTDEERKDYEFRENDYLDAVVMPWYRNNDQPQYFYVAEICENLTPQSQFPGCEFKTFEEYYQRKYHLCIQNPKQPLLDVDHTSARLNFLTPRYVNRKGMALPTSSENTKRAKRENLEQKQILVPELCAIHPFSASLWRQAVCLPCILYRVNTLLLANSIRCLVASQIHGLGISSLPIDYEWEALSFGWSLSDVVGFGFPTDMAMTPNCKLKKLKETSNSKNAEVEAKNKEILKEANASFTEKEKEGDYGRPTISDGSDEEMENEKEKQKEKAKEKELSGFEKAAKEPTPAGISLAESLLMNNDKLGGKSLNEILSEQLKNCRQPQLEIGTWTNDMAGPIASEPEDDEDEDELLDPNIALPSNLMMLDKNWTWGGRSKLFNHRVHRALYGSPTHWGEVWDQGAFEPPEDLYDDGDNASVASDLSGSDESYLDGDNNLKIQFEGNTAEALDKRKFGTAFDHRLSDEWTASEDLWWNMDGLESEKKSVNSDPMDPEETMRAEFDAKVDEKVGEIKAIVKWDEIDKLPAREVRLKPLEEETPAAPNPHYETLFKILTPVDPPPIFNEVVEHEQEDGKISLAQLNYLSAEKDAFSFDYQPSLGNHVGPSPCQILQALTMSNANDGLNLERLETIGDSFLKYAITSYLFCTFDNIHEGKLSHLRSKQVSNVHLYRLGRKRGLGGIMVAAKFEPHDNWLPPCYHIPKDLDKALIHSKLPPSHFSMAQVNALKGLTTSEIENALKNNTLKYDTEFIPYNLVTQQSIPDKSIADCVEALIGAYLTSAGPYGALLFMSWLGMRVLPSKTIPEDEIPKNEDQELQFYMKIPKSNQVILFEKLKPPKSPLLRYIRDCDRQLDILLKGYNNFEDSIGYKFRDRSYLLQAFTHASYASNVLTDCYQRLEFLGDAILDYLITRHLYEDPRQHSPGSLTDLRSALVNNTIFASLAVKSGFHKYFRHSSPGLSVVLQKFVTFQEQHAHTLTQDFYLMGEEECDEAEDIEVPKALGDVFESVAGAIFLDSGMSLDAVWSVYYRIMKGEIDQFSQNVPKSPIRELLELEPETAKFGKPEKLWDGRRVRVTVEIFGVGLFRGIGRNYRIAKCTAAKCALRHVRKLRQAHKR